MFLQNLYIMRMKLRKTFYIGLGGTGMNAILRTKKMFVDKYGKVPPMIGFLGIDTDGAAYDNRLRAKSGEMICLEPYEQCSISVRTPIDYYRSNKRQLSWLPESNVNMITNLDHGAGQVRTNGRLALVNNIKKVTDAISNSYAQISGDHLIDNPEYELLATSTTDVHIVFSVCGGTGCGTFIDLAYLLRSMYNRGPRAVNIAGYGVLPNVFHEMNRGGNAMAKTKPNAYGAIEDLDFLMHLGPTDKPVFFDWITDSYEASMYPFDALFLVDNKNAKNIVYNHVDKLAEMISLALISASGEVGKNAASINDNVEKCMIEGDLDVNNKRAWVSTIGASQISFRGQSLAEVYALLAKQCIVQRLLNASGSGDKEANQWIDLPDVNIRENNGQDNVIDYLYSNAVKDFDVDIKDIPNIKTIIEDFEKESLDKANETVTKKVKDLQDRVVEQLTLKVDSLLKGDCSVKLAIDTLTAIKAQINIFIREMSEEKTEFSEKLPSGESKLKAVIEDLLSYADKVLKSKSKQREKIKDAKNEGKALLKKKLEIVRRTAAIQFYNAILAKIEEQYKIVDNIKQLLDVMANNVTIELSERRNQSGSLNTVEVDLTEESQDMVSVDDEAIVVSQFIQQLPKASLYDVKDIKDIEKALDTYCRSLKDYKLWESKTIDEIINEMTVEQFNQVIKRAMDKAEPFMKINGHGKLTSAAKLEIEQSMNSYYFVCLPDAANSRFTKDDYFKKSNDASLNISFITTGMNDKIIIYRQVGTFPAFAIDGVELFPRNADRSSVSYHFDHNVERRMKEEKYQLQPKDDSEETMMFWVYSLVFGLIKYDDTKRRYFYYDQNSTDTSAALNEFMVDTGEHYRDLAYEFFDHKLGELKDQYEDLFNEKIAAMGTVKWNELVQDIKANYLAKYSQSPIDVKASGGTRNQEKVKELLAREMQFVKRELGK